MPGRLTLSTRNLNAVIAGLRQYERESIGRAQVATTQYLERLYNTAQLLCPVASGYQKEHMRAELTPNGLGCQLGFEESDFVGQTNPATGEVITYPYFITNEFGNADGTHPAQPCIFPARAQEEPRYLRDLKEAIRPRRRGRAA